MYVSWDHIQPPLWQSACGESEIRTLVASLRLDRIEHLIEPVSDDLSVAILELESRAVVLRGKVLKAFLVAYLGRFPLGDLPLDEKELEERFKVAFDERTQPLTRYLLQISLRYGKGTSLARVAEQRYKRDTPSFRKLQRHLLRAVAYPMRDLQLWRIDVEERTLRTGKSAIAGYAIGAGPALLAFHRYVYLPLRQRQLHAFATKHLRTE